MIHSYAGYHATIDNSPDSCGEATQDQVNAMADHIAAYLERHYPGISVKIGIGIGTVFGPEDEVIEEIKAAIDGEYQRHLPEL